MNLSAVNHYFAIKGNKGDKVYVEIPVARFLTRANENACCHTVSKGSSHG